MYQDAYCRACTITDIIFDVSDTFCEIVELGIRNYNIGNYWVRTPSGARSFVRFRAFLVFLVRFFSIAVGCGRRGIRSTCVQVHVPTHGGIARFVVVSGRFCAGDLKNLLMSTILEWCVSRWLRSHFRHDFFALSWFRADLGDADVMRMQDLVRCGFGAIWRFLQDRVRVSKRASAIEFRPSLPP